MSIRKFYHHSLMIETPPKKTSSSLRRTTGKKLKKAEELNGSGADMKQLVLELGIQQIELEEQNKELRREQVKLDNSRRKYLELYDFAPLGYLTFDKNGVVRDVNVTGAIMLGTSKRLLLNKPFSRFMADAAGRGEFLKHMAAVVKGQTKQTSEFRLRGKDGVEFYAELQSIPAEDEQGALLIRAALRDVTDRKKAEEALRESEQKFILLFQKAGFGVVLATSTEGVFVDVNEAAERMFGYSREEVIGRTSLDLGLYPDPSVRSRIYAEFASQGRISDLEVTMRVKSGDDRVFLMNIIPMNVSGAKYLLTTLVDITGRKHAEEALREQMQLVNLASDAIIIREYKTDTIMYWNDGAANMYGWLQQEVLGKSTHTLLKTRFPQPVEEIREELLTNGTWKGELNHTCRDGKVICALSRWTLQMENGLPKSYIEINTDITERKRAEEALKASEERFRGLIEKAPVAISVSRDGKTAYVNQKFLQVYGYQSMKEVIGHTIVDQWAPESQELVRERSQKRVRGEQVPSEYEGIGQRKDGSRFPAHVAVETIELPDGPAFMAFLTDITERKRAEEALRASEQRLALTASGTEIGMFEWDVATGKAHWTEQVARLLGGISSDSKIISTEFSYQDWSNCVHPEDLPNVEAELRRCMSEKIPYESEYRVVWPDQSVHWIAARGIFHNDVQGRPERMLGVIMDITDQKWAEGMLVSANKELHNRTRELAETNRELEAFSYSVSHDLRAPLRHIEGFIRALEEQYAARLDDNGRKYLQYVGSGARKMNDLVEALLGLSQYISAPLHRTTVDLSALVRAAASERRQTWPERRVELVVAEGVTVEGDLAMLQAAITNLIGNAWKFTTHTPDARIEFGVREQEGQTVYFVKDNGSGFDQSYGERLFLPFQRLHTQEEFPGMGIGLATVQRIIRRHGGRLWAVGEVGKGATFYFTLE
jgi:PAS domain S-box-containing protein